LLASGGTNGVGGFLTQQWVIATDDVDRREGALQVLGELGGSEFHRRGRTGRRGAPQRLLARQFDRRLTRRLRFSLLRRFQCRGFSPGASLGGLLQLIQLGRSQLLQAQHHALYQLTTYVLA